MLWMSSWILSMKALLISAGVVTVAVGLSFSFPMAVDVIPAIWSVIMSWLKPPYLYLIINGIIITIAASSRFHQNHSELSEQLISVKTLPKMSFESFQAPMVVVSKIDDEVVVVSKIEDEVVELKPVTVNRSKVEFDTPEEKIVVEAEDRDVFVDSMSYNNSPPAPEEIIFPELHFESLFPVREKPLVTSRFGQRKPNRVNPEGARALRVARAKKHETLESTWKLITEGRHVPFTRHVKKSDTWEHGHAAPAMGHVPKSGIFKERPEPARIGKEPSVSHDELNRRVEAFIKKVNEEMRMQRQESLNQYMEMINRGV